MAATFKHFSHLHNLYSTRFNFDETNMQYRCGMCDRLIVGIQSVYFCEKDVYMIHESCAKSPQHIMHPFHHHRLNLVIRSRIKSLTYICCHYCDLPIHKDDPLYYACGRLTHNYFAMHITCANIPLPAISTTTSDQVDKPKELIQFVCHKKPMELVVEDKDACGRHIGDKCFSCRSVWSGFPVYSCVEETCNNFLHKSCAEMLPLRIRHPFHQKHPLTLRVSKPLYCDSCRRKDCMLVFSCAQENLGCKFNLCTSCAFLEKKINCRSHDHLLSLVESFATENGGDIRCLACLKDYKKCDEVDATQNYLFRCMECGFNLHFLCGPLPVVIKYEFHIHPLRLVDHSDTENDSDEYYCDVCEEKRDPQCRLYYCATCKFNAHIHCLIREILKVIKGDNENVPLCVLGENRWDDFEENAENIKEFTLRDIMESLTQQEKDCLNDPFHLNEHEKTIKNAKHNLQKQQNSRFECDIDSFIENVDRIKPHFNYSFQDYSNLLEEFTCFKFSQGLKVDEMYLRQQVIDVNGYLVPKTLAPILKTLLRKLRDLGGKSGLSTGLKSVAATILCSAIDEMYRANFDHISKEDLKQFYLKIEGATKMAGFREILNDKDFHIGVIGSLPGLQALRCYKDTGEKLKLKKIKLLAELASCEMNMKKLERYFNFEQSDFLKDCFKLVLKNGGKKIGNLCLKI